MFDNDDFDFPIKNCSTCKRSELKCICDPESIDRLESSQKYQKGKERAKAYYQKNKERIRARAKEYEEKNRDRINARAREREREKRAAFKNRAA